ncbi:MAG TPA: c-type cytochrome, partial [Anaerolineales bacterium]
GSAALLAACASAVGTPSPAPTGMTLPPTPAPEKDSWILVDLPADATQLQHGAEVYRLVCSACHAYSGEGLTDAWRATWDPKDQNCWQSKCHGPNHPPDCFLLPIAPAIVGNQAMAPFATAADLHAYIQSTMPWQHPNGLTEEEGWAVTAYVIKLNRMNPGSELNAQNAADFRLHPVGQQSSPTAAAGKPASASANSPQGTTVLIAGGALIAFFVLLLVRRARKRAG